MTSVAALLLARLLLPGPADVDQLLERLRSEDAADRRKAQEELVGMGPAAVPAILRTLEASDTSSKPEIDRLVKLLGSRSWKDRNEATEALVRLGPGAIPALQAIAAAADAEAGWRLRSAVSEILEKAGQDESLEDVRVATLCDILAKAGDARAVSPLLRLLVSGAPERRLPLRLRVSLSLGQLRAGMTAEQAAQAADHVLDVLERVQGPLDKALLLKTLGRLGSPAAIRPLSALLLDRSEKNVHLKRSCMSALAEIGQAPGIRAVVESLDADDVYVRQGALAILAELAHDSFGFDPRKAPEENRDAVARFRAWGAARYGAPWGE